MNLKTIDKQPPETPKAGRINLLVHLTAKWGVLIAVGTATFMSALDGSVVNTVLPIVNRSLRSEVATSEWVVVIYLLLLSGLLPGFGRLGDLIGHKSVYTSGFFIFITASVLCGLSPTILALIAARGLQSIGAAMLSANSPAILTKAFPSSQRGQALGIQATMTYLGLTVGPSLGGWLTEQFGWRVVFFINLPVGLLALALGLRFIPRDSLENVAERFDWPGALTFLSGFTLLLLALNQGHHWGWASLPVLTCLTFSALLLVLFFRREKRISAPMLDLRLFRNRAFTTSLVSAVINYICVYGVMFLMPFYLLQGRGLSPSQTGALLTAQPIIMAIVAPVSGTLSDRIGTQAPATLGMGLLALGLFLLSRLGLSTSLAMVALSLAVTGLGIGIFISPNNSALMGSAPRHRQGIAAGLLATARNVGMVLGVGLAGAIFNTLSANHSSGHPVIRATQISFTALMGVAMIGAVTSALRGNPHEP